MFKPFLTVLSYEIVHYIAKHPDFFEDKAAKRMDALDSLRIPKIFKEYLSEVGEAAFLRDLQLLVSYSQGRKGLEYKKSHFFKSLVHFFTGPFATKLDSLAGDFYTMSDSDRGKVVEALIKGDSKVANTLKDLFMFRTPQELAGEIQTLAEKVVNAPLIVVQSPREMDIELKKSIRKELTSEHPNSFPSFQINRKLIGGIRIFQNGDVVDHSWLNRVLRFTNLITV